MGSQGREDLWQGSWLEDQCGQGSSWWTKLVRLWLAE